MHWGIQCNLGNFFVVGHFLESASNCQTDGYRGHTVGNHTYHHPDMSAISDKESFQKELDAVSSLFQEVTGQVDDKVLQTTAWQIQYRILRWQKNWGIRPFLEPAYVGTGMRMHSRQRRRLWKTDRRIHPGHHCHTNTSSTNGKILDELLTRWEDMG